MNLEPFLHGWWSREEENDRMNDQAANSSLDSGVFSDDGSRDTVCLSPYQDLLSSGDESFSLTPEDPESRQHRMSSGGTRQASEEMPETPPGVGELPDSGCHSPREPFYDISLQRSSSLENTMFYLGFCDQTVDRSFIPPGQSIEKENLPASGTVKRCRNSTKQVKDDVSDETREASNTERCATPKESDSGHISTKRKRNYVDCAVDAIDIQQPLKMMRYSLKQKQSDEDLIPDTKVWAPEIADLVPSQLVRLKCLLPGEAFKQKQLPPVIEERRQTTSPSRTRFLKTSKKYKERGHSSKVEPLQFRTSEVTILHCSSPKDVPSKNASPEPGMSHFSLARASECFFSEDKPSISTGMVICKGIEEKNNRTPEKAVCPNRIVKRRRPVEISSTPMVVKQEFVFKIPEMLPLRKWSTKPIRGIQDKKGKQSVYTTSS